MFFFKVVKSNKKKKRLEKPTKEKLLLLIPENIDNRKLGLCKTIKYQLTIEKKGIRCFKN